MQDVLTGPSVDPRRLKSGSLSIYSSIPAMRGETMSGYPVDAPPVLVGHYWLTGTPVPLSVNVACTDYSVAKNGKLVAYRWDGETALSAQKFHWVGKG
ncbi:hypothetical protein [Rhodopirellula bahusiensis]|uniref:hypothetical protein n=1 Tax=Rhodopirellula bahusiensis TaxID=2014065 RepID=UPI00326394DA